MIQITSYENRSEPSFLRDQFSGVGMFSIPLIKKQEVRLEDFALIGYDKVNQSNETNKTVHFFLDDYRFESIYKNPDDKIERLKKFNAVLSPDFSMYTEMPVALQLYNCFRNRWTGAYLQQNGITVIPTVRWGNLESFNFCFDGIEKGCVVAVSTLGVKNEKSHFMLGYNEMRRRIKPEKIICYGKPFDDMKGDIIEVDYAETNNLDKGFYIKKFYGFITPVQKGGGSALGRNSANPKPREIKDLNDLVNNPEKLSYYTPQELYDWLKQQGYKVQPLSRGSLKGKPFENGGGFKINYGGDGLFQYHPSGFHHGNNGYYKISDGNKGIIRYDINGNKL